MELGGRWRTGGVLADVCGGDGVWLKVEVCDGHCASFCFFSCLFSGCANILGRSYRR